MFPLLLSVHIYLYIFYLFCFLKLWSDLFSITWCRIDFILPFYFIFQDLYAADLELPVSIFEDLSEESEDDSSEENANESGNEELHADDANEENYSGEEESEESEEGLPLPEADDLEQLRHISKGNNENEEEEGERESDDEDDEDDGDEDEDDVNEGDDDEDVSGSVDDANEGDGDADSDGSQSQPEEVANKEEKEVEVPDPRRAIADLRMRHPAEMSWEDVVKVESDWEVRYTAYIFQAGKIYERVLLIDTQQSQIISLSSFSKFRI